MSYYLTSLEAALEHIKAVDVNAITPWRGGADRSASAGLTEEKGEDVSSGW